VGVIAAIEEAAAIDDVWVIAITGAAILLRRLEPHRIGPVHAAFGAVGPAR